MTADLSILNGLRSGVWFKHILVERPELQLHFDAAGELVTQLPQSQSQETTEPIVTLPFRDVTVVNGKLAVHQLGRESFVVDEIAVNATADGPRLSIETSMPNVLSSRVDVQSNVDITTLRANSRLQFEDIRVASQQLATMPLVPASINSRPWLASTSVEIIQSGTIVNLNALNVNVRAKRCPRLNDRRA